VTVTTVNHANRVSSLRSLLTHWGGGGTYQSAPVILGGLSRTAEFSLTDFLYYGLPLLPQFVNTAFVKF
jgi:hypothetical protein